MIKITPNGEIFLNETKLDFFVGLSTSTGRRPLCIGDEIVSPDVSHLPPDEVHSIITGYELRRLERAGLGGRPRTPHNGKPRTLYLDDATVSLAREIGGGSVSAGIRKAVAEYGK